jgi:MFS family permease
VVPEDRFCDWRISVGAVWLMLVECFANWEAVSAVDPSRPRERMPAGRYHDFRRGIALIMPKRSPKIYLGWWMNWVTAICSGLPSGFYMQGIGVLLKPIALEFGLSRAAASLASGIGALANGIAYPITGWLSDKLGPKWFIIGGTVAFGFGLLWMNFIHTAMAYFLVWGVLLGVAQTVGSQVAIEKMLTDWFVKKRGLAMGVRFTLFGLMDVVVLPVMSWQLTNHNWRATCLIWAGVTFATVPLLFFFTRQKRPEYYGLLPDGATLKQNPTDSVDNMVAKGVEYAANVDEIEFTVAQIMKKPAFWILTYGWVVHGVLFRAINVHWIPFLTDMGVSPVVAGSMMALAVVLNIPARFIGGAIVDHVSKEHLKYVLGATFLFVAAGVSIFLVRQTTTMVYIALFCFGFGNGAYTPIDIAIRGRFFGRKAYGSNVGISVALGAPFSFFAPICVGRIFDLYGSYVIAFCLLAGISISSAALMLFMRPPKPAEKHNKVQGAEYAMSDARE